MSSSPVMRSWQASAKANLLRAWSVNKDETHQKPLIAACPGSGKTWFSVEATKEAIKQHGIDLVIVVAPSINIKNQWRDTFQKAGIRAHDRADNEALRFRVDDGRCPTQEGWTALCVTYAQIARDHELFAEMARRRRTLVIADEVHHADDQEVFGKALQLLADSATLRLALSGTPFNSSGGALAMCASAMEFDDTGRPIRKALPLISYPYAQAISDRACRPVEFIKVLGKATATYKSLANDTTFQKVTDLAKENRTDRIGVLLDTDGEFFHKMAVEALTALHDIQRTDKRAGMLIVAKDKQHGNKICTLIESLCRSNPQWSRYTTCEIYNDTTKAHDRIKALERDSTDIVVTVRMISEGVDIKRLRVGLYATDYRTRMFFVQFVGRFIRWEDDRLKNTQHYAAQHARVIIPGHIDLLIFAREIEQMVDIALISNPPQPESLSPPPSPQNELLGVETEVSNDGLIYRGKDENDRRLAERFFEQYPSLKGILSEAQAIAAMRDSGTSGESLGDSESGGSPVEEDWSCKNDQVVRAIVRIQKMNGDTDDKAYSRINRAANQHVGIKRKDAMTPVETLKKRHAYLVRILQSLYANDEVVL